MRTSDLVYAQLLAVIKIVARSFKWEKETNKYGHVERRWKGCRKICYEYIGHQKEETVVVVVEGTDMQLEYV